MLQGFCSWFDKSSLWFPAHGGASSRVCLQGREHCTCHAQDAHATFPGKQSPLLARTGICIIYCFHHISPKTLCLLCFEVKLQTQQPEAGGAPRWDVPGCPSGTLWKQPPLSTLTSQGIVLHLQHENYFCSSTHCFFIMFFLWLHLYSKYHFWQT